MITLGEVLNVNAGRSRTMEVQGERITTGFYKQPVTGPVVAGLDGLELDDHVDDALDRDRALLLYQRSYYEAWDAELGRTLPPGIFGENLTVDAPENTRIALGAELRIGTVRLRVTQPRIPCRKMAVRLQEGEGFPGRYLQSGRLGFFCAVVEPGELQDGDPIELLRPGVEHITVAELARRVYLDGRDRDALCELLDHPELPVTWRVQVERLVARLDARSSDWPERRDLVVGARRRECDDVLTLDLEDSERRPLPAFEAGQFLTVDVHPTGAATPVQRNYTVVGRTDGRGYRIAVKRERAPREAPGVPDGVVSGYVHDELRRGARIAARAPRGRFVVEPGSRPVALVSAGIGVTPMVAMLRQLRDDPLRRDVHFLHGARSSHEHAFAAEVRRIAAGVDRLHTHIAYSRPLADDVLGRDFQHRGRLTVEVIAEVLPSLRADFYVCGPAAFMEAVVTGLGERQVPSEWIRFEYFGAAPRRAVEDGELGAEVLDAGGRTITVTFARSGVTVPWRENAFSVLALAEHAGLRPGASCRTGLCATCQCTIDRGSVDYAIPPLQHPPEGEALICVARPTTSLTLDL